MSAPSTSPESLRARAIALRVLASKLDDAQVSRLSGRAGVDVWRGPTPDLCRTALASAKSTVANAAHDVRVSAKRLDEQAAQLAAQIVIDTATRATGCSAW